MWEVQNSQELQAPMLSGSEEEPGHRRPFEFITSIFKRRRDHDTLDHITPPDITLHGAGDIGGWQESSAVLTRHDLSGAALTQHDLSRVALKQHDPSRVAVTQHDPSRGTLTQHDPSRGTLTQHDPSRGTLTQHDPSRVAVTQHDPSRGTLTQHDPSRVTLTQHDPSRVALTQHDPSRGTLAQHDPSRVALTQHDPSRVVLAQLDPSRVALTQHDPSRVALTQQDPSIVALPHHELSRVALTQHDPSRGTLAQHDPSIVTVPHHEVSRVALTHHDPSRGTLAQHDPSIVTVPHHEVSRVALTHHDPSRGTLAQHDPSRVAVPYYDTSRKEMTSSLEALTSPVMMTSPEMMPSLEEGGTPVAGTLHHTPVKSRDIGIDMEAIRLSRQDNPYLQRVADSHTSLNDEDPAPGVTGGQHEDRAHLVTQESQEGVLSLSEVHQHLIRSPPPTSLPKTLAKNLFVFPTTSKTPPPSSSQGEGSRRSGSLKPLVTRQHEDVLDHHLRQILHTQRQLVVSRPRPGEGGTACTTSTSMPGSPAHTRTAARRSPHARTLSEEATVVQSVGGGAGAWSGNLAPVLPPGRRQHSSSSDLLLNPAHPPTASSTPTPPVLKPISSKSKRSTAGSETGLGTNTLRLPIRYPHQPAASSTLIDTT
nr:uncharacterized protein LOC123745540 [Procambarus clarkii]